VTEVSARPESRQDAVLDLARARAGDDAAFTRLVAPLRAELHAHCYRMLGSAHDADDALQDALLKAWRGLPGFAGRSSLRTWLYSVATNCCLDAIAGRRRRALPVDLGPASPHAVVGDAPLTDVAWLGPYAGDGLRDGAAGPSARYEQREAVELAFVAALQHLPGNQRAALLLFDVLGFSAAEIADVMATTTASVNSALQRARATVEARVPERSQQETLRTLPAGRARQVVAEYTAAFDAGDVDRLLALFTADATWSMPPLPHWYRGRAAQTEFADLVAMRCGSWRVVPTTVSCQPGVATYLQVPGDDVHRAWSVNVLTFRGDLLQDVTSFVGPEHFTLLGLPLEHA